MALIAIQKYNQENILTFKILTNNIDIMLFNHNQHIQMNKNYKNGWKMEQPLWSSWSQKKKKKKFLLLKGPLAGVYKDSK